jgi:hypothetical protein
VVRVAESIQVAESNLPAPIAAAVSAGMVDYNLVQTQIGEVADHVGPIGHLEDRAPTRRLVCGPVGGVNLESPLVLHLAAPQTTSPSIKEAVKLINVILRGAAK